MRRRALLAASLLVVAACRQAPLHEPVTAPPSPVVVLGVVARSDAGDLVALRDLRRARPLSLRADLLELSVADVELLADFDPTGVVALVTFDGSEASDLAAWTANRIDEPIAIALRDGVVCTFVLRAPLADALLVRLSELSRPKMLEAVEYLTGRAWTHDELRRAIDP
jgi:hypothetical protein